MRYIETKPAATIRPLKETVALKTRADAFKASAAAKEGDAASQATAANAHMDAAHEMGKISGMSKYAESHRQIANEHQAKAIEAVGGKSSDGGAKTEASGGDERKRDDHGRFA